MCHICLNRQLILIHPLDMLLYLVHNPYLDCPNYGFCLLLLSLVADVLHLGYWVAPAHCFLGLFACNYPCLVEVDSPRYQDC